MKTYTLFHDTLQVGSVTQSDLDFPNWTGEFVSKIQDGNNHVAAYIAFSIASDKLLQESEEAWQNFIAQEESQFNDLIESNKWYLIDVRGEVTNILIPLFYENGQVVWRYRFAE